MPEHTITDHDIRRALSTPGAFAAGFDYRDAGRTKIVDSEERAGGLTIRAETLGSGSKEYTQTIRVTFGARGGPDIDGRCSCPVAYNCKHVAAALLSWREAGRTGTAKGFTPEIEGWLGGLEALAQRMEETYPPELRQRLFYIVRPSPVRGAVVSPVSIRLGKMGALSGSGKAYDASNARSATPAKFLRASDLGILLRLAPWRVYGLGENGYGLQGDDGAMLLQSIVATGRAVWGGLDGPVLCSGPALKGAPGWAVALDGSQRFTLTLDEVADAIVLPFSPALYVEVASGRVGVIETDLPGPVVLALLDGPALPPAAAEIVADRLASTFPTRLGSLALPRPIEAAAPLVVPPAPRLRLTRMQVLRDLGLTSLPGRTTYPSTWRWGAAPVSLALAELSFDYGPFRFGLGDRARTATRYQDGRLLRLDRDLAAERSLARRLGPTGLRRLADIKGLHARAEQAGAFSFDADSEPEDFLGWMLDHRPALETEGWTVLVDSEFDLHLAEVDSAPWTFELSQAPGEGSGVDWFDLRLGVRIDGAEHDILPALLAIVRRLPEGADENSLRDLLGDPGEVSRTLLSLPDGRIAPLPTERVLPILEALLAVWGPGGEGEGGPRLAGHQAADLSTLQARVGQGASWSGGDSLLALGREFEDWKTRIPTILPDAFTATLRPYQQTGLDWLQMLARTGFGGLLADDMGLGKTVQTLAHLAVQNQAGRLSGPALIVAPTSVLANWVSEAERFTPMLRPLLLRGAGRDEAFGRIPGSDLVITSYPLLVRDKEVLLAQRYSVVVFDEAQTLRNPLTAAARAASAVEANQRIGLSGTPVENHLGDLWSLMNVLNPGLLGDPKSFSKAFRTPIEKRGDVQARTRLARRVRPFLLRRTKDEAAPDLPPRIEIEESVELTPGQRDLYEATRLAMQTRVRQALASKGLSRSTIVVLDALLKLRQVCCDPRLVKDARNKVRGSAKLTRLLELVDQLRAEGRKALVFSQFTSMLDLIGTELDGRGLAYARLTGETEDRKTPVARFQSGEVDLFLISLKAGGTGLNLTAADAVILYDPWWNPAVEAQAIDRAHRIGRTGTVFIHRLIAEGTVEGKMVSLQARKRELAAALWEGGGAGLGGLTEADVTGLFD